MTNQIGAATRVKSSEICALYRGVFEHKDASRAMQIRTSPSIPTRPRSAAATSSTPSDAFPSEGLASGRQLLSGAVETADRRKELRKSGT